MGLGSVTPNRQVGRFTLADLVEDRPGCQIWRAVDGTLNREVALWLIPLDNEFVLDVEVATQTAATIDDRRIVRVLDAFWSDTHLVVVTEWVEGEVLRDHLTEPMNPVEAGRIAFEVARGIESAHAKGIAHGRLRPSNVLIGPDGEVRISGFGIDGVLAGIEPAAQGDPVRADLHGIGAALYACLTGRWPGDEDVAGVPAAPQVEGHTPPPSRILADVPESLDDICARTVISVVPPRGRPVLTAASQAREMLGASLTDLTGKRWHFSSSTHRRTKAWPRILVAVGALLAVLCLGALLWNLLHRDAASAGGPASTSAKPTQSGNADATPQVVTYRIASARDFDPLGNGEENPGRIPFSYDGDRNTAWRTVTYYNKSLDKPGVGVLLDLGAPRSVGSVTLNLVGNGTDLQVLTSNEPGKSPKSYELMAQATEAGEKVRLKSPRPASARYVLVWMTGLPQVDGGWRGGIREVKVTS
ncbi:MAG: protein kinase family protein [Candidatus Nanopelagicales bacterium]